MSLSPSDQILTFAVRLAAPGQSIGFLLSLEGLYLGELSSRATPDATLRLVSFALPSGFDPAGLGLIAAQGESGRAVRLEGLWLGATAVADEAPGTPDQALDETLAVGQSLAIGQAVALEVEAATDGAPAPPVLPEGALVGTAAADRLEGTAAGEVIFGGGGADVMIGGQGDDTYYVDDAGDRIVETYGAAANGFDTIVSTVDYALAADAWVETLRAGSDAGLSLTGNKGYNTLVGGDGDDRLDGGAGNDELDGGAGDDLLVAGLGTDTLDGGEGFDTALYGGLASDYRVRFLDDGRVVVRGSGTYDYLSDIERLRFADEDLEVPGRDAPPAVAPAPVAVDDDAATEEDTAIRLEPLANDEGEGLAVTGFQATSAQGGSVALNADGSFSYRPAANFAGTDSFTYQVTDRSGATASATASVVVAAVNDAPEAQDDLAGVDEDTSIRLDVLANDRDADGDALTIAGCDAHSAQGGSVMVNDDGTLSYTPAADFNGTDSFRYTVVDQAGATSRATVTVVVAPVNDAPEARDDQVEASEDSSVRIDVLANDRDADGDALTLSWFQSTTEKGGAVVLQEDGSLLYKPAADYSGADSFSYKVADATGAIGAAMVMILVAAVNDLPEARADSFEVPYGESFAAQGLLDNDSDVDGDGLDVIAFDAVSARGGAVEVAADGSFSYLPPAGFSGDDSFTYTIGDGQGGTATQTVSLRVALPDGALVGTAAADRLDGTTAGEVIFGGGGADVMIGGQGDDTYYVDDAGDRIVETYGAAANGFDTVISTVDYALAADAWVETLQAGSDAGLSLTGNKGYNTVIGGAGDDRLDGGAGNDELQGGAGDDLLIGGLGDDTLDGGAGFDTALFAGQSADYEVRYADDGRVVVRGEGYDRLSGIERLQFADKAIEVPTPGAGAPEAPAPGDAAASPPPGAPAGSLVGGPTVPAAQAPGEVLGLQLVNDGGQAAAARAVTIGQAFAAGELLPGGGLVARLGDAEVPVQLDVRALHDDGSVRHAVLTFDAPAMAPGQRLDVMLAEGGGATGAALDPLALLQAQGHDLTLEVTLQGGSQPVVLDLADLLAQAQAEGSVETLLAGPKVTEVRISAAVDESLEARFDVRAYEDGTVRTSVVLANEWGYKEGAGERTYDARILADGQEAFAVEALQHYSWSTWRQVVTTEPDGSVGLGEPGGARVLRDIEHLVATGALPRLDTSIGLEAGKLDALGGLLAGAEFGPLASGSVTQFMPGTGDRPDIGVLPDWAVAYLQTQDARAEALLLGNAEVAGSIPWHVRDAATGSYASVDERPQLWLDARGSDSRYGEDALPVAFTRKGGGFTLDLAHEPDVSYLAYLLTGDGYYLDNLMAQASFDLASVDPGYRNGSELLGPSNQARGQAWGMRTLANAAWITPDDSELKSYFEQHLESNLDAAVKQYVTDRVMAPAGELEGWLRATDEPGKVSPWQNNYFATVMDLVASRGHEQAGQILEWQANFLTGLWLNGDNGYDPHYGAPYKLHVYDASTGNVVSGEYFTTWQEVFEQSFTAEGQAGAEMPLKDGLEAASFGGSGAAGYAALARAGLAALVTQGVPEASEAFGWVVEHTQTVDPSYAETSKFALMPEFADGSTLRMADMHVGADGADSLAGTAANELYAGGAGDDAIDGGGGIDLLYGGEGDDVIRGGAGDDQLFGGAGGDLLVGGEGNDLMKGGKGADRFEFGAGNSGADRILDFDASLDRIGVSGGYQVTESAEGAVVIFDDGSSVTLIGLDPDSLAEHHFYAM